MAIGGVLFDIDGVLVTSWKPIPGAAAALAVLAEHQIACCYLTNTTTRTRQQIAAALSAAGIEVRPDEVITAAALTADPHLSRSATACRATARFTIDAYALACRADDPGATVDEVFRMIKAAWEATAP